MASSTIPSDGELTRIRELLAEGLPEGRIEAGRRVVTLSPCDSARGLQVSTEADAIFILQCFLHGLLEQDAYEDAAVLLWGSDVFNPEPECTREIMHLIRTSAMGLIMGAGSMSKTYTLGAWALLDWERDPINTHVVVISSTFTHAKTNLFSHICKLHSEAAIPMAGRQYGNSIAMSDSADKRSCIMLLAFPQGEGKAAGRLRGRKPYPRIVPHPRFGRMSRLRVLMDEAEAVPEGVWEDVGNLMLSRDGIENIKIFAASNPRNELSEFGRRCEPPEGWSAVDIETMRTWVSVRGWDVLRLDAARCENVVTRKIIYQGLQTFEGYCKQIEEAGGVGSPEYFIMCRGMFPRADQTEYVIPSRYLDRQFIRGQLLFDERTVTRGGLDCAFLGDDKAILAVGRTGMASGFRPMQGDIIRFDEPAHCCQLDALVQYVKNDSVELAKLVMADCEEYDIRPEHLTLDLTGNSGTHDYMRSEWGEVLGVGFAESATGTRILAEDSKTPEERCHGIDTEMYWAWRCLLPLHRIKISPHVPEMPLREDLTARRCKIRADGKRDLEEKKEFKRRYRRSPDHGDAAVLLVHGARMRPGEHSFVAKLGAGAVAAREELKFRLSKSPRHGIVDTVKFVDMSR